MLKHDGTISDGNGRGLMYLAGRNSAAYSMKFLGQYDDKGITMLSGTISFTDQATGKLSFLTNIETKFKAQINSDNGFTLQAAI